MAGQQKRFRVAGSLERPILTGSGSTGSSIELVITSDVPALTTVSGGSDAAFRARTLLFCAVRTGQRGWIWRSDIDR